MMAHSVLVTRRLAPGVLDRLTSSCEVIAHDNDLPMPRGDLLAAACGRTAVLTTLDDAVDAEFLDAAGPGLRIVANHAVGAHNINLTACAARDVIVTNTPGVLTSATADLTMALLLAAARRLGEGERWLRSGRKWAWAPNFLLGVELSGTPLGILGMGRIGKAIARRARGFDMPVSYHNRRPIPDQLDARWLPLDELLSSAHILVVSCPLTDQTRGLLDASRLTLLPTGAILVSITAGVVDEVALAEALDREALFAAAIDNHTNEPEVAPGLLRQERVVLSPHLGSATVRTRQAMGNLAIDNILAVLAGKDPLTEIKPK